MAFFGVLLLIATGLPALANGSAPVDELLNVCPHESEWAREVVPERGSDASRLRRLHAKLLEQETTPGASAEFAFRLVALAREAGVPAYFVAVDARSSQGARGPHLAVGIGHYGRIVVFDSEGVSKPDHGRLRLLDDRTAKAVVMCEAAQARLAGGDTRGALEQFETALTLDDDIPWAWSAMGEALRRQGDGERAMDAYERALELAAVPTW